MSVDRHAPVSATRPGAADPDGRPSEPVRAAATVALAAYLVGLVLAIATNSSHGSSPLLRTVKSRLFAPLLRPAWLDLGHDHRLTAGPDDEGDHDLEIAPRAAAGGPLVLPGPRTGERAARWRRLARSIAVGTADADGGVVAAGVARGAFATLRCGDVDLRVVRLPRPEPATAVTGDPAPVYSARIRRVAGDVQLVPDEPPEALAPLVSPAAGRPEDGP